MELQIKIMLHNFQPERNSNFHKKKCEIMEKASLGYGLNFENNVPFSLKRSSYSIGSQARKIAK